MVKIDNLTHDVFVCHNGQDKPAVRELAEALRDRGLAVWLDEWELRPGMPWQDGLESALLQVRAVAVLRGAHGAGPWAIEEQRVALREAVRRRIPVIPVWLPGAEDTEDLPPFLSQRTWVDLRGGLSEAGLGQLIWGITGERSESGNEAPGRLGSDPLA